MKTIEELRDYLLDNYVDGDNRYVVIEVEDD